MLKLPKITSQKTRILYPYVMYNNGEFYGEMAERSKAVASKAIIL